MKFFDRVDEAFLEKNPLFNRTFGACMKTRAVVFAKVAAEEIYFAIKEGTLSLDDFTGSLKKRRDEEAYWVIEPASNVVFVYGGIEYGMEKLRGTRDWKTAMIGGAFTGAFVSAVRRNNGDQIVMNAIARGAVAVAVHLLQN